MYSDWKVVNLIADPRADVTTAVGILGPGAVGGSFAVRLSQANHRTICVATPETVGLMALSGITLEADGQKPVNVHLPVVEELVQPVSLLLITVKAPYLRDALERVDPEVVRDGVVVPLMNVFEHMEPIRERFGDRGGESLALEAHRVGRMQIVQMTASGVVTMASNDLSAEELERAAEMLRASAVEIELEDDEKRVPGARSPEFAVLSTATALSRRPVGEPRKDPEWRPRMEAALAEACAIAAADGVRMMPSAQWTRIMEMDYDLTTSAARDVLAGRRNELDAIAGSVVRGR